MGSSSSSLQPGSGVLTNTWGRGPSLPPSPLLCPDFWWLMIKDSAANPQIVSPLELSTNLRRGPGLPQQSQHCIIARLGLCVRLCTYSAENVPFFTIQLFYLYLKHLRMSYCNTVFVCILPISMYHIFERNLSSLRSLIHRYTHTHRDIILGCEAANSANFQHSLRWWMRGEPRSWTSTRQQPGRRSAG